AGRLWRAPGPAHGTVIMCHGFGRSMYDYRGYQWIATRDHWDVVRFDFREHGQSSHAWLQIPTLGYYEIWDLKAVIDWAEAQHLPKPYVCYGQSMGASIALRWAGQDQRISAVLAQSPYKNALDATHKYRPDSFRVQFASHVLVHGAIRRMLAAVDIPTALEKRDDLRIWLTATQKDWFPEDDQREILAASHSPSQLKRFDLIPVVWHGEIWKWSGNDQLIESFLAAASPPAPRVLPAHQQPWMTRRMELMGVAALVILLVGLSIHLRRRTAMGK
ncbi:MAG TPA: alpha/beta fold hydrolase, partial [Tepidisphaeraceae bacterium]